MKIMTKSNRLVILLEGTERFYALKASLCLGRDDISSVVWEEGYPLQKELGGFRAPGTAIPFTFQAGSYWRRQAWEFRYLRLKQQGQLVISTKLKKYSKIRLTTDEATAFDVVQWFNTIQEKRKIS